MVNIVKPLFEAARQIFWINTTLMADGENPFWVRMPCIAMRHIELVTITTQNEAQIPA